MEDRQEEVGLSIGRWELPSKEEIVSTAAIRGEGGSEKSPGGHLVSRSALGTFHLQRKYPRKEFSALTDASFPETASLSLAVAGRRLAIWPWR